MKTLILILLGINLAGLIISCAGHMLMPGLVSAAAALLNLASLKLIKD